MNPIKQCYLAYHHEAQDAATLNEILGDAREMLPCKEFDALVSGVSGHCRALDEKAFSAGFRFAVQLLVDGMR